jgi:hypothetical protein
MTKTYSVVRPRLALLAIPVSRGDELTSSSFASSGSLHIDAKVKQAAAVNTFLSRSLPVTNEQTSRTPYAKHARVYCSDRHASLASSHLEVQRAQLPVEHLGADLAHGVVEGGEAGELVDGHLRHERPRCRRAPPPVARPLEAVEVARGVPHRGAHLLQPLLLLHAQRRVGLHVHSRNARTV